MTLAIRARVTRDPISADAIQDRIADESHGGVVTFEGIVRRQSRGKRVEYLEYDAYVEMAERQIDAILAAAHDRWPDTVAAAEHRIGRLEIGDVAVVVVAASAHRAEAFDACRHVIDTIKQDVTIWKKEVAEDGEEWIE